MRRGTVVALASALSATLATTGWAAGPGDPCDAARRPWVLLTLGESPPPAEIAVTLLRDVRAGLVEAEVCDAAGSPRGAPVATLEIAATGDGQRYGLEVRDALTHKRVGREVDVGSVPRDGRSIALAIAAAELLQAAWAELLLARPAQAARPSPPPPAAADISERLRRVASPPAERRAPAHRIGARGAFELFSTGLALAGGDLFFRRRAVGPWSLGVAFVARGALPYAAAHGRIGGSALGAELDTEVELLRSGRVALAIEAAVSVIRVAFRGSPAPGAAGSAFEGVGVVPRGGLSGSVDLAGAVRLDARAAGGGAAAAVVPLDGAARAGGLHGAAMLVSLGAGAVF